jgi:hypothetical protein
MAGSSEGAQIAAIHSAQKEMQAGPGGGSVIKCQYSSQRAQ